MSERQRVLPYESTEATSPFGLGLHHVQLALPPGEEEVCRRFYVDVLGMTELRKPPVLAARGGLWVRSDTLEIHLGVEEDFRPSRKGHPGILVADIDGLAARLTALGVKVIWDDNFPGHRRFYAADCHENRLEFLCPEDQHKTCPRAPASGPSAPSLNPAVPVQGCQSWPRSISTGKGAETFTLPVNISPSR